MSTEFRGTEVLLAHHIMATEITTSLREETGLINETTGQQIEIELVTDLIGTVITGVARVNDSALVWHIVLFFSVRENVPPPPPLIGGLRSDPLPSGNSSPFGL